MAAILPITNACGICGSELPPGGLTGQVLAKLSNADHDCVWVNQTGGGGGMFIGSAAETIFQYRVVALNSSGTLFLPDNFDLAETKAVLGIALSAGLIGDPVTVQTDGVLATGSLWTPGAEYFLGTSGILVSTPPTSGNWLQIAFANSATELIVRPQRLITRA